MKRVADEDVPIEITDYAIGDSTYPSESMPADDMAVNPEAIEAIFTDETHNLADSPGIKPTRPTTEFVTVTTATQANASELLTPTLHHTDAVRPVALAAVSNIDATNFSQNPLIHSPVPTQQQASRLWGWLAGLAAIGLTAQAAYFFRSDIAQHYPELRPHLLKACETLQCEIPWGRLADAIKIESSDLIEPPGKPGRILLLATIANRATTKHDFPHIEVKLMDAANTVLASRIFTPTEYLARIPNADEGMNANTEIYVNLQLELVGKTTASGYGLRAFYP